MPARRLVADAALLASAIHACRRHWRQVWGFWKGMKASCGMMFLAWQITIFLSPVIRVNCWWFRIYYLTCFFRIITLKVSTCHFLPQDPQRLPLSFSHCDQLADVWSRIFWLCDRCNEKLSNNDITWWTQVFNPWCFQNKHTQTMGYCDIQTCPMRLCNFEH